MKIVHQINFMDRPGIERLTTRLGIHVTINDSIAGRSGFFTIEERDENWQEVRDYTKSHGISDFVGTVYEKEDFEKANWFLIRTSSKGYPQPEGNFGYLEMTYDLTTYCRSCGIGKKQNNPFRFKNEPKNASIFGLNWISDEFFVNKDVKQKFELNNINGIEFLKPVFHKSKKEVDSFFQAYVKHILPPALNTYNCKAILCKYLNEEDMEIQENWKRQKLPNYCGRVKYHVPKRGPITIEKEAFSNVPDVVKISEWFGSGGEARQPISVSKKLRNLIIKEKWKGVAFDPIFHEEISFS